MLSLLCLGIPQPLYVFKILSIGIYYQMLDDGGGFLVVVLFFLIIARGQLERQLRL